MNSSEENQQFGSAQCSGLMRIRHNRPIGAHFHSGGAKFPYLGDDLYEAFG
jgi:hypothetical protein